MNRELVSCPTSEKTKRRKRGGVRSAEAKSSGTAILCGYYGMQNTGDDAFLAVTAWATQKYLQAQTIFARAHRLPVVPTLGVRPLYPFPPLRGLGRLNLCLEVLRLRRVRHLVWGGGSVVHSERINEDYCRMMDRATVATSFAVGISVGPFPNTRTEVAAARFLNRLAFVGVRDQISYERTLDIAPKANVNLTFDLAPLLLRLPGSRPKCPTTQRGGLGIALCNYERFVGGDLKRESERLAIVTEAIRTCVLAGAVDRVVMIDFNGHPRFGDHELHAELAHRLGNLVRAEHVRYCDDPAAVMQRIGTLRGMLAMRLHAAVFAFCNSIPTVMLCYHEKCREWSRMIGAPIEQTLDAYDLRADKLSAQIEAMFLSKAQLPAMTPAEACDRALSNWAWCL